VTSGRLLPPGANLSLGRNVAHLVDDMFHLLIVQQGKIRISGLFKASLPGFILENPSHSIWLSFSSFYYG
jgi:hypothetical protein